MARKKRSFHFDLGNSSKGPVGFCARVEGTSRKNALNILKKALPDSWSVKWDDMPEGVEYIEVYFNPDFVTEADIDDSHPVEGR